MFALSDEMQRERQHGFLFDAPDKQKKLVDPGADD
jgi:hypothetical protein